MDPTNSWWRPIQRLLIRQLHPPTGVDHAVFGSVTAPGSRDLVVGKASILELYRVHGGPATTTAGDSHTTNADEEDGSSSFFLELAGTFPLAGNVTALAVIPVAPNTQQEGPASRQQEQQDILVVSFGPAKVALVTYDMVLGRLATLSIHNFDPDAIGPGTGGVESGYGLASALKDRPATISSCDPAGRCVAAVVAGCQLVVLPALRHVPRSVFLSEEARKRALRHRREQSNRGSSGDQTSQSSGTGSFSPRSDDVDMPVAGNSVGGEREGGTSSHHAEGNGLPAEGLGGDNADDYSTGNGRDSGMGEKHGVGGTVAEDAAALASGGSREAGAHWAVSKPFTVDLEEAGITGFIKAATFLEGLHEPALALLYEPIQTCPGRLAFMRSTCQLALLSLNLTQGRAPTIWRVDHLPHDSWDLVAVPSPIGGVQVISTNAVIHVNQSEVRSILAVNGYARASVEGDLLGCPLRSGDNDWGWASFRHSHAAVEVIDLSSYDVCIELDMARCAFLTRTSLLLTLRNGEVYALRLHLPAAGRRQGHVTGSVAPNRVVGQSMRPVGLASPCSVLAVSPGGTNRLGGDGGGVERMPGAARTGLVFMGSRVGDSLLVKYAVAGTDMQPGNGGERVTTKRESKVEVPELEDDGGLGQAVVNGVGDGSVVADGGGLAGVGEVTGRVYGAENGATCAVEASGASAGMEVDADEMSRTLDGSGNRAETGASGHAQDKPGGDDIKDSEVGEEQSHEPSTPSATTEVVSAATTPAPERDADIAQDEEGLELDTCATTGRSKAAPRRGRASRTVPVDTEAAEKGHHEEEQRVEDMEPAEASMDMEEAAEADQPPATPIPAKPARRIKGSSRKAAAEAAATGSPSTRRLARERRGNTAQDGVETLENISPDPEDSGTKREADSAESSVSSAGTTGDTEDKAKSSEDVAACAPAGKETVGGEARGEGGAETAAKVVRPSSPATLVVASDKNDAEDEGQPALPEVLREAATTPPPGNQEDEIASCRERGRLRTSGEVPEVAMDVDDNATPGGSAKRGRGHRSFAGGGGEADESDRGREIDGGADEQPKKKARVADFLVAEGAMSPPEEKVARAAVAAAAAVAVAEPALMTTAPLSLLGSTVRQSGVRPTPVEAARLESAKKEEQQIAEEEEQLYGARLGVLPGKSGAPAGGGTELALLGSGKGQQAIEAVGFQLKVVDSLCTLGPIVDATLVPSVYRSPKASVSATGSGSKGSRRGERGSKEPAPPVVGGTSGGGIRTSLVCAAGYGKQGALAVFSAGLRTEVMVDLSVPGATGVYTTGDAGGEEGEQQDTLVLISSSSHATATPAPGSEESGQGAGHTRVLAIEEDSRVVELPEGDENPFVCDAATVDVCAMAGGTIVQGHAQGLRVTRQRQAVQDVLASEDPEMDGLGAEPGVTVLRASAAGAHACCLLSNHRLHLMVLEEGDETDADLLPVGLGGEEVEGAAGGVEGAWEGVEAMCMFGVQEQELPNESCSSLDPTQPDSTAALPGRQHGNSGLFLEDAADEIDYDGADIERANDSGNASGDEEWATLYGTGGRTGILNPCPAPVRHRAWEKGAEPSPDSGANGRSGGAAEDGLGAETQILQGARSHKKGWWGGASWGAAGSAGGGSDAGASSSAYLVVCRRGGSLEVLACEGRGRESRTRPVFRASGVALSPSTLWNELLSPTTTCSSGLGDEGGAGVPRGGTGVQEGGKPGRHAGLEEEEEDEEGGGRGLAIATGVVVNGRRSGKGAAGAGATEGGRGGEGEHDIDGKTNVDATADASGKNNDGHHQAGGAASRPNGGAVTVAGEGKPGPSSGSTEADGTGGAAAAVKNAAAGASGAEAVGSRAGAGAVRKGEGGGGGEGVSCPSIADVIVHPVGAVDGPEALRCLVLVMHLDNGDLLVYQARMSNAGRGGLGREQVVCFSKLAHDLITRPVKGVPQAAAMPNPSRGRALRGVRSAAGQEGVCFARPGCRSALVLAERGAVCLTPIAQDDLGDGSGASPLPPGAPPSWAGIGLGSLAPLNNRDALPGGGFAGITAGGGRLRFISAAPAMSQLVTPCASGGGGLGGGGQGHFVAAKIALGATVHGLVHLPKELVQAGKMGDILRGLLRRGHYVALVSRMVDALAEEPKAEHREGGAEQEGGEDEEMEGPVGRHVVKHKNWTVADPKLGGAPPLLVHKFELRVLALAPGASSASASAGAGAGAAGGVEDDNGDQQDGTSGSRTAEEGGGSGGGNTGRRSGGGGGGGGREGGGGAGGVPLPCEVLAASTVETHPLNSDENGLCVKLVRLEQGGSPKMYVAVGTGMNEVQGEDKAARGRLLLFEVDYAYLAREDGGHEHAVKLRQVFAKEQLGPVSGESGPVSAVSQLDRHLILSVGKKLIVNRWDPKSCTLEIIGFHDPRVYVVSLSVVKNKFVLVGDAYGSVQLLVWRQEDHSLTHLSKDHEDCEVYSAEYLIDEPGMGIVVADGRRNLKVLQYAPKATDSRGGTKLLCQSDFFLGSRVAKLTRRRTRGNLKGGARYCLLAGTLDGGLGAILPVDERVFRRLYALQGIMSNALAHTGAANPRAYRLFDHGPTFRYETKKNMLDGTLLWRFVGLDARTQHDLTRAIGTTVDRVMANLLDIDLASLF